MHLHDTKTSAAMDNSDDSKTAAVGISVVGSIFQTNASFDI